MLRKNLSMILLMVLCTSCSFEVRQIGAETPTSFVITATLPPSLTPRPTETPLPPLPTATVVPVDGIASTHINVRAEPSTVSAVLGILPANTKVQIVGKDPGGNWWQILYQQGNNGKGWVAAQFITTAGKPEVPIIGGGGTNPENANAGIIQQKLNIRSGPGVSFNSIGTLNPQDVVNLTGKDANGAWLQIEFAAGPDGKGWINAAFVQAKNVDKLPIVTDAGQVLGTGTPMDTPLPPSPTVAPAASDNDSAQAPAASVVFSANSTRSLQFSGDVSAPTGDAEDWIQFTPYTKTVMLELTCGSSSQLTVELLQHNQPVSNVGNILCGERKLIATVPGTAYLLHVQAKLGETFNYSQYTVSITSIP